jgi:hypothetical protein
LCHQRALQALNKAEQNMARITVEDCLDHVDKPTVIALREIEEGFITASILDEPDERPPVPQREHHHQDLSDSGMD